jgi:hypothetical protein
MELPRNVNVPQHVTLVVAIYVVVSYDDVYALAQCKGFDVSERSLSPMVLTVEGVVKEDPFTVNHCVLSFFPTPIFSHRITVRHSLVRVFRASLLRAPNNAVRAVVFDADNVETLIDVGCYDGEVGAVSTKGDTELIVALHGVHGLSVFLVSRLRHS